MIYEVVLTVTLFYFLLARLSRLTRLPEYPAREERKCMFDTYISVCAHPHMEKTTKQNDSQCKLKLTIVSNHCFCYNIRWNQFLEIFPERI